MADPVRVRSVAEEYRIIASHRCDCGGGFRPGMQMALPQGDGTMVDLIVADCGGCGTKREFKFAVDTNAPEYKRGAEEALADLEAETVACAKCGAKVASNRTMVSGSGAICEPCYERGELANASGSGDPTRAGPFMGVLIVVMFAIVFGGIYYVILH